MIASDDVFVPTPPMRPAPIECAPPTLLTEPLEFIFAEHFRHRQMCRILEYLAVAQQFDEELVAGANRFLRHDLTLHVSDEEQDLFPLLRRRCAADDNIEDLLARLSADHALDKELAAVVCAILARSLADRTAPALEPGGPEALQHLAQQEKGHMALENAVVIPLARRWLTAEDIQGLGKRFAARRGVDAV